MVKHPVVRELEREERSTRNIALVLFFLIISILTAFYFYRAEPSLDVVHNSIVATVISDPPDGVILTSAEHRIKLESGQIVKARGLGRLPANFRGRVVVRVERGKVTGREIFYIERVHPDDA